MRDHPASRKTLTQGVAIGLVLLLWGVVPRAGMAFPTPGEVLASLVRFTASGELPRKTFLSLEAIAAGLGLSLVLAFLLTGLGFLSRWVGRIVDAAITIMHPLPELALLPLVILWVGIGFRGTLFLVLNSALWAFLVNCTAGFRAVPPIYTEVGRNIGLGRLRLIAGVMVPATAPYLVAGLKTSWARAWRTVIGAEMVMGISAKAGGWAGSSTRRTTTSTSPGSWPGSWSSSPSASSSSGASSRSWRRGRSSGGG